MKCRFLSGLLFALALLNCSSTLPPGAALAGQWMPMSAELGGQTFPVANFGGAILRLTTDTYEFADDKGTYSLLSTGSPARMDIRGREGPNAGRTILAIYALAGGQLSVCYQLGPGERPHDFASPNGSQVLLVHYKRIQ